MEKKEQTEESESKFRGKAYRFCQTEKSERRWNKMERENKIGVRAFAFLAFLSLSLSLIPLGVAEEAGISAETEASANVNLSEIDASLNEEVSGFRIFWKEVGIFFTFNQEVKAKKELDLARLRLIQAKVAARNGNEVAMQEALEAHARVIARVEERIQDIDEGSSSEIESRESAEMFIGIERAIEVHELHVVRMKILLEKEDLTDEQRARIEASIGRVEENIAHLRDVEDRKKERIKIRLRAIVNLSDEEAENVFAEIESSENLAELRSLKIRFKDERRERIEARKESRRDSEDDEEDDDSEVELESESETEVEVSGGGTEVESESETEIELEL